MTVMAVPVMKRSQTRWAQANTPTVSSHRTNTPRFAKQMSSKTPTATILFRTTRVMIESPGSLVIPSNDITGSSAAPADSQKNPGAVVSSAEPHVESR
jgi:hypothetical protein